VSDFKAKMYQNQRSPRPLAGINGTSKGRRGVQGGEWEKREGYGGERRGA